MAAKSVIDPLFKPKAVARVARSTCSDITANPMLCPAADKPKQKKSSP